MGNIDAKDALYEGFASIARAMSSGRRLELIGILEQGERHVDQLATEISQSIANTSFHLRALASAGLVSTRRDGNRIYYRLASDRVGELLSALSDVASAHHDDMAELSVAYLGDRSELEQIGRIELNRRLTNGDVIVIDVRPPAEFEAGHIAGATSVPLDSLQQRLGELPADLEIVAYCRGTFCVFADEAVRQLNEGGRPARRLEGGFPQWQRAGFAVGE